MVICTWIKQLVGGVISWNMYACWRFVVWTIGIITLPFRALSALHREKMTAKHFEELQFEIENLLWNHKRLEGQFALAIKERKVLESMLAELEEEHDKAIVKIEHLEKQVHNLKTENLELRAIQGKRAWDFKSKDSIKEAQTQTPSSSSLTELLSTATPRKNSSTKGTRKDSLQKVTENEGRLNPTGLIDHEEAIYQRRDVALSQSVFSALLSLLVGSVVYEAKDPCMPRVGTLCSCWHVVEKRHLFSLHHPEQACKRCYYPHELQLVHSRDPYLPDTARGSPFLVPSCAELCWLDPWLIRAWLVCLVTTGLCISGNLNFQILLFLRNAFEYIALYG